jgi:hypothetical protein
MPCCSSQWLTVNCRPQRLLAEATCGCQSNTHHRGTASSLSTTPNPLAS